MGILSRLTIIVHATSAPTLTAAIACCSWPVATAQPAPVDSFSVNFPAGFACPDFGVNVQSTGGRLLTFTDRQGNAVKAIQSGSAVVFTNLATGATFEQRTAGAVTTTTPVQGTTNRVRVVASGGNGLIFFPGDSPPISIIYYLGRVTYFVDDPGPGGANTFTFVSSTGKQYDVCKELAG